MKIRFHINQDNENSSSPEDQDVIQDDVALRELGQEMLLYCRFCPNYILNKQFDHRNKTLLVGVLLDIQITGTQRIIEKFASFHENGIFKVTYTLNAYLGMIVESITFWGGDILRIHGDRCLNLWQLSKEDTLYEILHNVILCSCFIKKIIADFSTLISHDLHIKISLTCGNIYSVCQGEDNKLLVLRGDPMLEINRLNKIIKPDEILISSKAWAHMIQHRYYVKTIDEFAIKLMNCKIAYKANERKLHQELCRKELELSALTAMHAEFMKTMYHVEMKDPTIKMTTMIKDLERRLPPRKAIEEALRTGHVNVIRSFVTKTVRNNISTHQPVEYLTKLTTVSSLIIVIKPNSIESISDSFIRLTYLKVSECIANTNSFIHIFEVTSKIRIIILSGVETVTGGTGSKTALISGYKIHQVFQSIPGVTWIAVGIFHEYLYCSVLGHPFRREYVVMGLSLNKAFKILDHNKGKVICDYKTFKFSKLPTFSFRCLGKKKCKIQSDTGQLMEYNECADELQEETFSTTNIEIIGREKEISEAVQIISSRSKTAQGVILSGGYMIGKATILHHVAHCLVPDNNLILISLAILKITSTPYSSISRIYSQLYRYHSKRNVDLETFSKLPLQLIDRHEFVDIQEDTIDLYKYRVLNYVRILFELCNEQIPVIVIKNISVIDGQSWDILEYLMDCCNLRILATADIFYESEERDVKLIENPHFSIIPLGPLPDEVMVTIACKLMGVNAINTKLSKFITDVCNGYPGFVSNCIYYFINYEKHHLSFISKYDLPETFTTVENFTSLPNQVTIMVPKATSETNCSVEQSSRTMIETIAKGVYFALEPYQQMMIKTSAVLGELFSRDLLALALYSPQIQEFQDGIENFFHRGFFECGATFINNYIYSSDVPCCRCLMTKEEMDEITQTKVPRYRFCKLLHFKDAHMKTVGYSMLTVIQRRDLHMLCTEVLENSVHYCPTCLRDPVNSFMIAPKYHDIVKYCFGTEFTMAVSKESTEGILKDCIRDTLYNPCQCQKQSICRYATPIRTGFDPSQCRCLDMKLYVFQTLIYHSKTGKHQGKQIFYLSVYGYLLTIAQDVIGGISVLREAFELCMVNIGTPQCQISSNYRQFSVGRVCMMLASALIHIRKINQAKAQITLAFRQYNIPSVSFRYHHFQCFLKKSYLLSISRNHRIPLRPTWVRWEIGMCFVLCSKIFAMEGNLKNAKHCAKYSLWILNQINERVPMLFESYCNVVNLYRYGLDHKICEKLQKYVTKELLSNYFNDRGYYAKHLSTLMSVEFEMKLCKGKLSESVTLCYRIVDTTLKLFIYARIHSVAHWFSTVFGYTLRLRQLIDIMHLIEKNSSEHTTPMWYFTNALDITLLVGYSFVPMHPLIKEVNSYLNYTKLEHLNWETNYMLSLLYLHTVRIDNVRTAEKYKPICIFTESALQRPFVMRVLLNLIEANLMDVYYRQVEDVSYTRIELILDQYMELANIGVKAMPLFYPRLYCLQAWWYRLENEHKKMMKTLRKAEKISRSQGNTLFVYFVHRLRSYWVGNQLAGTYLAHLNVKLEDVLNLFDEQSETVLVPYPVVIKSENNSVE